LVARGQHVSPLPRHPFPPIAPTQQVGARPLVRSRAIRPCRAFLAHQSAVTEKAGKKYGPFILPLGVSPESTQSGGHKIEMWMDRGRNAKIAGAQGHSRDNRSPRSCPETEISSPTDHSWLGKGVSFLAPLTAVQCLGCLTMEGAEKGSEMKRILATGTVERGRTCALFVPCLALGARFWALPDHKPSFRFGRPLDV
jgi:hypothetical protein